MLLYRAGTGALHTLPDALGRHPPERDKLILARTGEWTQLRSTIRGVQQAIIEGEFDDDEPEPYTFDPAKELPEGRSYDEEPVQEPDCSLKGKGRSRGRVALPEVVPPPSPGQPCDRSDDADTGGATAGSLNPPSTLATERRPAEPPEEFADAVEEREVDRCELCRGRLDETMHVCQRCGIVMCLVCAARPDPCACKEILAGLAQGPAESGARQDDPLLRHLRAR